MNTNSEDVSTQPTQADKDESSLSAHLWFPEPEAQEERVVAIPQASGSSSLLRDRLYIGNLHPTVDEYALLQVFTKFGKVSKLDFLFHKTGPNKGKPRGYAFLQYLHEGDAQKALESINGKLLRGRKLAVTFAHQAPLEQPGGMRQVGRARRIDARPTTLSMMKSGIHARSEGTDNKIAMMEAKLRQMESSTANSSNSLPPKPPPPLLASASRQYPGSGGSLSSRNPAGPTVRRPTTRVEPIAHLGHSVEADTTPSTSLTSLYTRPEVVKSSMSCKRLIPGVKIVKERSK
ncbi:RNA-binding domain-containing protein [Suillus clintonianus]|uniref:RNA-binding domain-containing protein n=1 Tax=Suillus clintonianus TaxID=1904413 RepID=UPI001B8616CB|nr:RNA-binding domain-containing protein [Suillus clintonianus]KAG2128008.1 RNA-binding domain-containing protein [Suillus clintonianus]